MTSPAKIHAVNPPEPRLIASGNATAYKDARFVAEVHAVRAHSQGRREEHNGNNR